MDVLDDQLGYTNIIVLTLDGATPRFTSGLQNMLRQVSSIFGDTWWDFMMVGVTKWKYSQAAIDEREDNCDFYGEDNDFCINEEKFKRTWTQQLNEKFHLNKTFLFTFMDSFSQSGPNVMDDVQQAHWREETDKLWKEATESNHTFDFKVGMKDFADCPF